MGQVGNVSKTCKTWQCGRTEITKHPSPGGAEHPGIHQLVDLTVIIDINFRYRLQQSVSRSLGSESSHSDSLSLCGGGGGGEVRKW